jgi:CTP:molybdopterin cytidylyltransferase MocA
LEAIILAGGKAERLGDAAGGRPKSLVEIAGKPLVAYQVGRLASAGVEHVATIAEAVRGADAAVIVTEWPELAGLASEQIRAAMANPLIIDGRNMLDPAATRAAGFVYEGIGRPNDHVPRREQSD